MVVLPGIRRRVRIAACGVGGGADRGWTWLVRLVAAMAVAVTEHGRLGAPMQRVRVKVAFSFMEVS